MGKENLLKPEGQGSGLGQLLADRQVIDKQKEALEQEINEAVEAVKESFAHRGETLKAKMVLLNRQLTKWLTGRTDENWADPLCWQIIESAQSAGVDPRQLYQIVRDGEFIMAARVENERKEGKADENIPEYWFLKALKLAKGEDRSFYGTLHSETALSHFVYRQIQKAIELCQKEGKENLVKLFQAVYPFLGKDIKSTIRNFWDNY